MNYDAVAVGVAAEPIDISGAGMTPWRYSYTRQRFCIFTESSHVSGLAPGKSCDPGLGKVVHMNGLSSVLSAANTLAIGEIGVWFRKEDLGHKPQHRCNDFS